MDLLEFLRTHDEAFRSRSRLASLYADFRYQRSTNPDGYRANASAWLRALTAAANEGLIPSPNGTQHDRFVLHTTEELGRALQTQEYGPPLALSAVMEDAVARRELVPLRDFLQVKKSVYAKIWIPTPWQVVSWGLRQIRLTGGTSGTEEELVAGHFVIVANVESAAKAVVERAAKQTSSNASRVYSRDLFVRTFAPELSSTDVSVLLTHLVRDRSALAFDAASGTLKFGPATTLTPEDVTIASLRTLIKNLEPQIEHLMQRITDLDATARKSVAERNTIAAKSALRQKKLAETTLQQRTATLAQLEEVYAKLEQAADQVEIVHIMEASGKALPNLNAQTGGVETINNVIDGLREEMATVDEIGQIISEPGAEGLDEAGVDEEFEAMEKGLEEEKIEREAEETRRRLAALEGVGKEDKSAEEKVKKETTRAPPAPAEDASVAREGEAVTE